MVKRLVFKFLRVTKLGKIVFAISQLKKNKMGILRREEAMEILCNASGGGRQKKKDGIVSNRNTKKYDLDIIIPIYNVQNYLDDCLSSVFDQKTKYSTRVICINDGSTDASGEIMAKYEAEHQNVLCITQLNRGLSGARNRGLDCLNSKYVFFLDSDDILPNNSIEALLDVAYKNDADVVEGAFEYFSDLNSGILYKHKSGRIAKNDTFGFAWGKVIKTDLFQQIRFPEGRWFEDTIIRFYIYLNAEKIFGLSDVVYRYRKNRMGITHSARHSEKSADTVLVMLDTFKKTQKYGLVYDESDYSALMQHIILSAHRMENCSETLRRAAFSMWHYFLIDNFSGYYSSESELSKVEELIKNKNFHEFDSYFRYVV